MQATTHYSTPKEKHVYYAPVTINYNYRCKCKDEPQATQQHSQPQAKPEETKGTAEGAKPDAHDIAAGLNLTGICDNAKCVKQGQEVVVSRGMGVYSVYDDEHNNRCPRCKSYVRCTNMAFTRCKYRYAGTVKKLGEPPHSLSTGAATEVHDDWKEFDQKELHKNWISLKIITEPL